MISPKVMDELKLARHVPTVLTVPRPGEKAWTQEEQDRFWDALEQFPQGPWTSIAAHVGSKSTRQAMTHAQKLRQKLNRWHRRQRSRRHARVCVDDKMEDDLLSEGSVSETLAEDLFEVPEDMLSSEALLCGNTGEEYLDDLLTDIDPVLDSVLQLQISECDGLWTHQPKTETSPTSVCALMFETPSMSVDALLATPSVGPSSTDAMEMFGASSTLSRRFSDEDMLLI